MSQMDFAVSNKMQFSLAEKKTKTLYFMYFKYTVMQFSAIYGNAGHGRMQ